MSAPISSFSKLSLNQSNMQSSHGQGSGPPAGEGKQPVPTVDDPSDESEAEHVLALYHCREIGSENDRLYAFQIADAAVSRCGVRVKAAGGRPQCSLSSCKPDSEEGCRHVRWLLDQLEHTGVPAAAAAAASSPNYYGHIASKGLENICEDLHWELRKGVESDEEEMEWQLKKNYRASSHGLQTRGMIRDRLKDIRDILATLSSQSALDYRKDIFESADDITMEGILVQHDLGATVSRLLVHDDNMFYQFKTLVPHNVRASDFFRKMELKAKDACRLLDEYIQNGPAAGQYDLVWCSQELVDIVNTISTNVAERAPLNSSSRKEAAKALVSILNEVIRNRNTDAYQDDKVPRRKKQAKGHTDRNLYQRLILAPSEQNPTGSAFVIKALQDLPEAQYFVEDLKELLVILETIGWGPAPKPYRERLAALISQFKSSTSSPGKRPAGSMDREVKRMK